MSLKAIWADNSPYSKLLLSVGVILLCAVTITVVCMVVVSSTYGIGMTELETSLKDLSSPRTLEMLKIVQTFSAIGIFVIPPLFLAWLFSTRPTQYLSLDRKPDAISILSVIAMMVLFVPFINFLGELNAHMHLPSFLGDVEKWMKEKEEQAGILTKSFLKMESTGDLIFNLIMIGLIPAIGEELLFRGVVQKLMHQLTNNLHWGVFLTAALFSAIHMQFFGFIPRFLLGALLGYLLAWSGNLWLPIIAHFVNNAGAVLFYYFYQKGISGVDPDNIGTQNDFGPVIISLVLGVGLMFLVYKRNREKVFST